MFGIKKLNKIEDRLSETNLVINQLSQFVKYVVGKEAQGILECYDNNRKLVEKTNQLESAIMANVDDTESFAAAAGAVAGRTEAKLEKLEERVDKIEEGLRDVLTHISILSSAIARGFEAVQKEMELPVFSATTGYGEPNEDGVYPSSPTNSVVEAIIDCLGLEISTETDEEKGTVEVIAKKKTAARKK